VAVELSVLFSGSYDIEVRPSTSENNLSSTVRIGGSKEIRDLNFGSIPSLFLEADICRKDLSVEIEGVMELTQTATLLSGLLVRLLWVWPM
jgi:hypothetical protein